MSEPTVPDWINAIAAIIGALAVVVGLFGANTTLRASRRSAQELRRSQVSEEMISLAFNVEDALSSVRNPFDSIPKEHATDPVYTFQRRYDRLLKHNELFQDLRRSQIRVRALIGDQEVEDAVDHLFWARGKVLTAIELLADYAQESGEVTSRRDKEEKDTILSLRRHLFASSSNSDELGNQVREAVATIEERLTPIARLDADNKN